MSAGTSPVGTSPVGTSPGNLAGRDLAGRIRGVLDVRYGNQVVLAAVGELAQHPGPEHRAALAPHLPSLLDPGRRGQPGDDDAPLLHVGRLQGRYGDRLVDPPLPVKGPVEPAGAGGRVSDEQQRRFRRGHHRLHRLVDGLGDPLGLVHHHQHVLAVEALELVGVVGRQPQGVAVLRQVPAGVQHPPAQHIRRAPVQPVNLPPQHVAHLPEGRRGAEHDGWVVGVDIPQHGHRGGEVLAQAVARLHRHAPLALHRPQHLLLLVPQLHAQDVRREPHRTAFAIASQGCRSLNCRVRRARRAGGFGRCCVGWRCRCCVGCCCVGCCCVGCCCVGCCCVGCCWLAMLVGCWFAARWLLLRWLLLRWLLLGWLMLHWLLRQWLLRRPSRDAAPLL